ncbi:MAG: NAD(P)-binding domain-containing protein, partial [Acidimicrobiales bacterium]
MTHVAVVGAGATGTRVARQLTRGARPFDVVLLDDDAQLANTVSQSLGDSATSARGLEELDWCDVVVLAVRSGDHVHLAEKALAPGRLIVSVSDSIADVENLLSLNDGAAAANSTVVVGSGLMPGLSDVLAAHGAGWLDTVQEVHVSKFGTGGPDCARQHHRALKSSGLDRRNGQWVRRPGGSGRELQWFPPPVQAADCYRAALGDPALLARMHPGADRITARMAATRRDRLTMHLPMLRRPHPEGLIGAIRVELRGITDGAQAEVVLGCSERPAVAAGAVAASAVVQLVDAARAVGAFGLAELVDPAAFLRDVRARG